MDLSRDGKKNMSNFLQWELFFTLRPGFEVKLNALAGQVKHWPEDMQKIAAEQIQSMERKYAIE